MMMMMMALSRPPLLVLVLLSWNLSVPGADRQDARTACGTTPARRAARNY